MKRTLIFAFLLALAAPVARSQVFWNADFDPTNPFVLSSAQILSGPVAPTVSAAIFDAGTPQHNVLRILIDSANQTNAPRNWVAYWGMRPAQQPNVSYSPASTYLKFDALASVLRPISIELQYSSEIGTIDLDTQVMPNNTNVFQTYLVPISTFSQRVFGNGNHPAFPTLVCFGAMGDPTQPLTTWPCESDNIIEVDNLSYIIAPSLNVKSIGTSLLLSWPTNATGFVLQQSADLATPIWTAVTNQPAVTNGANQISLLTDQARNYYRLATP